MTELLSANLVQKNNQLILEKNRSNNFEEYKKYPSDIFKKIKIVHSLGYNSCKKKLLTNIFGTV